MQKCVICIILGRFGSMKTIYSLLIVLLFCSCSTDNNKGGLEDQEQTIMLNSIRWACECADWALEEDMKKDIDNDSLAALCIFIEPADKSLTLPDTLGYSGDLIQFTGAFYKEKGYPKDYYSEQNPDKAKVFRYTAYEVIKSNYADVINRINQ